jgi:hypothetical protein
MSGTTNPEPLDEQELVLVLNAVTAQVRAATELARENIAAMKETVDRMEAAVRA